MDLLAVLSINLILLLAVYGGSLDPVRRLLGILLVSFLPGYGLASALLPRAGSINGVERIALSVGLSLALVPLIGIAIHFGPWRLGTASIISALSLWTFTLAGIAWWRRRRIAVDERFGVRWESLKLTAIHRVRRVDISVRAVLALLVLGSIGATAWRVQASDAPESFTQFYILDPQGTMQAHPTSLQVGQSQAYNVGIFNREGEPVSYHIRAYLDDVESGSVDPVVLEDGEKWEGLILVIPEVEGSHQKMELRLHSDKGEVRQRVHIFVNVFDPG